MYRVSARQLIVLALASAVLAGMIVALTMRRLDNQQTRLEPTVIADPSVASDEQNNIEIYRRVSPGVVNITSRGYERGWFGIHPSEGSGSGSVIDGDGHILTNSHVVRGATELEVQIENDKYSARIIGLDPNNDLAVIKVDAPRDKLTPIKLGSSAGLLVGQKVLAIGNPFGLQRTLTTGIISGLERPVRDPNTRRTIEGAIQTDASINPGNSGGPLLNTRGELIGINTAILSPSGGSIGIGFAVPVDTAQKIIPDLIAKGYVSQPWMGIATLGPLNRRIARQLSLSVDEGLIVGEVYRGSGAAAAGIQGSVVRETLLGGMVLERIGDVILSIDGNPIGNTDDLQRVLKTRKPGDVVQIEVLRDGRRVTLPVRLSEAPMSTR